MKKVYIVELHSSYMYYVETLYKFILQHAINHNDTGSNFKKNDEGKPIYLYDNPIFYELALAVVQDNNVKYTDYLRKFIEQGIITHALFEEFLSMGVRNGYGMYNFLEEINNFTVEKRIKAALLRHFFARDFTAVCYNLIMLAMREMKRARSTL